MLLDYIFTITTIILAIFYIIYVIAKKYYPNSKQRIIINQTGCSKCSGCNKGCGIKKINQ
jgi:hypothetical protein